MNSTGMAAPPEEEISQHLGNAVELGSLFEEEIGAKAKTDRPVVWITEGRQHDREALWPQRLDSGEHGAAILSLQVNVDNSCICGLRLERGDGGASRVGFFDFDPWTGFLDENAEALPDQYRVLDKEDAGADRIWYGEHGPTMQAWDPMAIVGKNLTDASVASEIGCK
ncbi:MAG: hypothetical protein WCQ21_37260 [Verrucomicrobiota bacterium]